jgi:YegS/Rv2252/BmrU family lipid kinase
VSEERSYALLFNPSSGGGRSKRLLPKAEGALKARGARFATIATQSLRHGVQEALKASEEGRVPVVMSGDGLIGAIGGALAGSDTPFGIIPGGRGNDFARAVGIPTEPSAAVDSLLAGRERLIDVGEANGRRFLCIASVGFDSDANKRANASKLVRGGLVYAYSALYTLATWKPADFSVVIDGERHEHRGYSVAVANTKAFGGGMLLAPGAEPDDGVFDIVLTGEASRLRFLRNLPKVFKGTHVEEDVIKVLRGSEVEISASRPFEVYADGEELTVLPATLRLLKRSLRVIVPATA